eukprot:1502693-Rhodomonas_salina.2
MYRIAPICTASRAFGERCPDRHVVPNKPPHYVPYCPVAYCVVVSMCTASWSRSVPSPDRSTQPVPFCTTG